MKKNGTLYIVATPIGNLEEMTPRAIKVLSEVSIIAAEDTRTAGSLFSLLGISKAVGQKFFSHHKFNENAGCAPLIEALKAGKDAALVSDAGMPCISDPGALLVRQAVATGAAVVGIGGGSAVIFALAVSGFKAEPFLFLGFLPRKAGELSALFKKIITADIAATVVFYESPRRIAAVVDFFAREIPQAELCLCNDLTKKFERIYRGTPGEVLQELQENPNAEKGEYTCVVSLLLDAPQETREDAPSLESALVDIMVKENCSLKEAVNLLAKSKNLSKREIYAASLRLKELFSTGYTL